MTSKVGTSFWIQFLAVLMALLCYSLLGGALWLCWSNFAPESYGVVVDVIKPSSLNKEQAQSLYNAISRKGIISLDSFTEMLTSYYNTIIVLLTAFIAFLAIYLQISMRLFSKVQIEEEVNNTLSSKEMKSKMAQVFRNESRSNLNAFQTDLTDLRLNVDTLLEALPSNMESIEQIREALNAMITRADALEARVQTLEGRA